MLRRQSHRNAPGGVGGAEEHIGDFSRDTIVFESLGRNCGTGQTTIVAPQSRDEMHELKSIILEASSQS